ncbi:MAG: type II toxin-antitoxin system ParD family antitoxin [Deltaproteobacteria bacterium]|jgi:antitoxin ParD1/3/4|nr:type II toxin-antitoxin system ParD family antitoxin [Deltaproteobacteria bacterium]MCW8892411.1 type II toxin-antitoxin system ParD family antitoxin [Deltaproteobacteria bacterium]MCW9049896.1 type II toxin-antitoxin system ParD family antitoxin [Deltaproteobacteria bacterium]
MSKNTSVTLGPHFEEFVGKQVESGHYGSVSEAIRAGLRLLEEKEARLNLLRKALVDGENSGTADYSLKSLIQELDTEDLK